MLLRSGSLTGVSGVNEAFWSRPSAAGMTAIINAASMSANLSIGGSVPGRVTHGLAPPGHRAIGLSV